MKHSVSKSKRPFTMPVETKSECSIDEVLSMFTDMAIPSGHGWVRMHCPFHEDHIKSASVNHQANAFSCMACGVRGNSYSLLKQQLRLDHSETVTRLHDLGGGRVSEIKRPRRSELFARELMWS